jgi:hypothetical protein
MAQQYFNCAEGLLKSWYSDCMLAPLQKKDIQQIVEEAIEKAIDSLARILNSAVVPGMLTTCTWCVIQAGEMGDHILMLQTIPMIMANG